VMSQPGQSYPPPQQGGMYPPGAPVQQQPGSWAAPVARPPNCPPGLEYLATLDQLLVKQTMEILEAFTGFETQNKYKIQNSLGQQIFYAKEDTDCCTRQCCGPIRPFDMMITDNTGNEIIHLQRPLACQACCFPCCLQTLEVQSPPGTIIGTVEQEWSIIYPRFVIKDASGEPVLRIEGPCWTCSCGSDIEFKVMSVTEPDRQVGMISKQWTGLGKEMFTDADNFGVSFPLDLSVQVKATMLGAVFLIDFMYYETKKDNNNHNNY